MIKHRHTAALLLLMLVLSAARVGAADLTFVVWSDTHFGAYDYADTTRLEIIDQINAFDTIRLPDGFLRTASPMRPAFLMHCGDITEKGTPAQWNDPNAPAQQSYLQTLARLDERITSYAVLGNHDSRKAQNIRRQFAERYAQTYYAFDSGGVHIVALDPYPAMNSAAPTLDAAQLDWLKKDLDALAPNTPVIIVMHILPAADEAIDRTSRLDRASSEALAAVIDGHNVLAFLHGHWHARSLKNWGGIPVIAPAGFAYWRDGCKNGHPVLGVIQVTDAALTVWSCNWHTKTCDPKPQYQKTFAPVTTPH